MNRRGFLKALAAVPAAPLLPTAAALTIAAPTAIAPSVRDFLMEAVERAINPPVIMTNDGGYFMMDTSAALRDLLKASGSPRKWLK